VPDVLVLGDANPDLVLRGDVEPEFGQAERLVEEGTLVVGGSGAIFACGAARLGLSVAFVGVVGDDALGRFMLDALRERAVDTSACVVAPGRPTGVSVILARGDDRAILTSRGTIADLDGSLVNRDLLRSVRHVHASHYFLQTKLREDLPVIFDEAHRAGATTSVDPNFDPAGEWNGGLLELLHLTDVFLPNAEEARRISGMDDAEKACVSLAERGPVVAAKMGAEGGLAIAGRTLVRAPAHTVEVVDTIGAGDAFDAGFVAGHLSDLPLERSLALAVACGSLATRGAGGTAAQSTMDEALAVVWAS
jgi:sugar/nucleoside kinase (ribokinase family)